MADRSSQPPEQHSPGAHNPKRCPLCASLRHPGQAKAGRALTKHLQAHPLPRQAVGA
jgi:hypothetical protein